MPVDFLTDEQAQAYAQFPRAIPEVDLAQFFYLDSADQAFLAGRRGDHNRLGLALLLCSVRYIGIFPTDLITAVPVKAVLFLAQQLGIDDPLTMVERYDRSTMRRHHVAFLKRQLGYREFTDMIVGFRLMRHLYPQAWAGNDRPRALFDETVRWLRRHRIVLPGITTLTRFVARFRERVAQRLWAVCTRGLRPDQCDRLDALVMRRASTADRGASIDALRRGETRVSGLGLLRALDRLEAARSLDIADVDLSRVPARRLRALAAYVVTSKVGTLADLTQDRRHAALLAFVRATIDAACDDAIDILDVQVDALVRTTLTEHQKSRMRTQRDLDVAALTLAEIDANLLAHVGKDAPVVWSDDEIREYVVAHKAVMWSAIDQITQVARPPEAFPYDALCARYAAVRRFLPRFLRTIELVPSSSPSAQALNDARLYLIAADRKRATTMDQAPLGFIPSSWRRHVCPPAQPIDRVLYTLCFLMQLQQALRTHDVFAREGTRWTDPRAKLLGGRARSEWEEARTPVSVLLKRSQSAPEELDRWERELNELYQYAANQLPKGMTVEALIGPNGQQIEQLKVRPLGAQEEPRSLAHLRAVVQRRLPIVDLSAIIREIDNRVQVASEFTHIGGSDARLSEFPVSLCAVLLAEGCNLPLTAVAQEGDAALSIHRLTHVMHNYVRPETLARANEALVRFHAQIPLAAVWGGGEVASADGLRFVVPVRTINAGPNPHYFGERRGITLMNYTLDSFFGFNGAIIPGTVRDSLFVLDGLLDQDSTFLRPREIMTDTASYSDIVFGLFSLLGYRFSPRLADIGDTRFWRLDPNADYGALNHISRHRLDRKVIERNWDDILRLTGSLALGHVRASEALRLLHGPGVSKTLGRAIAEVGRISKTAYLLNYIVDESYRRRIQVQLNRGEARHALARAICYGQRGLIRQAYREGQEEQLGALGLVVNIVVTWNTLYMNRILGDLRMRGVEVRVEDVARLSPLGREHIKLHGHYPFLLADAVARGGYLPLREFEEPLDSDAG